MADKVSKADRSRIMAQVKSKNTTPELIVRRLVHGLGYRYRLHVVGLPGTPDMVFPCRRKIINVNGCFWHMHSCRHCRMPSSRREYWMAKLRRNRRRDLQNHRAIVSLGWEDLTIWECELSNLDKLTVRLVRFLNRSGRSVVR